MEKLRNQQAKNLLTLTLLSLGMPMIQMGDEVRRTQLGNNNAYCQDNEISRLDWTLIENHADLHRFVTLLNARLLLRDVEHERRRVPHVVTGDEVDALLGLAPLMAVDLGAADQAVRHARHRAWLAAEEGANVIAKPAVPLLPAVADEAADLVQAGRVPIAPWTKWAPIRNLLLMAVRPGPSAELRAQTRTHVWGEVADEHGRRAVSRLHGPEAGLVWTTITALGAAQKALNCAAKAGYQTPASTLGKDFVLEGEGVTREDVA